MCFSCVVHSCHERFYCTCQLFRPVYLSSLEKGKLRTAALCSERKLPGEKETERVAQEVKNESCELLEERQCTCFQTVATRLSNKMAEQNSTKRAKQAVKGENSNASIK